MKKSFLIALLFAGVVHAEADPTGTGEPQATALRFNQWYVSQFIADKFPITDGHEIDKYVSKETLRKLRHAQDPQYADEEFYDADFFMKSQDAGNDWQKVSVIFSEYDPVCTNVYVAFGDHHEHVVIDCMIKEEGTWKVQSVARGSYH
jgi:Protein of unknown function (DUF3828)